MDDSARVTRPLSWGPDPGHKHSFSTPDFQTLFESAPGTYLVLLPDAPTFTIVAATNAYLRATHTTRNGVVGRGLFEAFPDNPDDPQANGVSSLLASLLQVLHTRAPNAMPVQRYDIRAAAATDGCFEEHHWSPVNFPVLTADGEVRYIIHRVEEVTDFMRVDQLGAQHGKLSTSLRLDTDRIQAELHLRDHLLAEARHLLAEREQAHAALAERRRLAALGADVGAALTQNRDLSHALRLCTEAIVQHLDAAFARIWTLNEHEDVLELRASAGLYTHLDGPHGRVPVGALKIGRIAQSCMPHLTNDVPNDPQVSDHAWAKHEGMVAFAGYPLIVEGRSVGVMAMFARYPLVASVLDILGSVANSIAMGIERKRIEDALMHQAEELARSNADLQQFAYVTSHDLQEPLRTMINFSQMLTRRYHGKLDAEAQTFLGYIVDGALRMRELIESMLTYSRVSNVETLPFAQVQLEAVLHWATMNLQTVIDECRAEIVPETLPEVSGDRVQLVQLFQNLISNALKYRKPDRRPNIHISASRNENEWLIAVKDNGIGIESRYHQQIFEIFKRLHGRDIQGTGIGLSLCRKIVERHGGRIWVESEFGNGATFLFTLRA